MQVMKQHLTYSSLRTGHVRAESWQYTVSRSLGERESNFTSPLSQTKLGGCRISACVDGGGMGWERQLRSGDENCLKADTEAPADSAGDGCCSVIGTPADSVGDGCCREVVARRSLCVRYDFVPATSWCGINADSC